MNRYCIPLFLLSVTLFSTPYLFAADSTSKLSAYELYVQEQQQGFSNYKKEHREFITLLKKEWLDYKKMAPLVRDETPKLPTAPILSNNAGFQDNADLANNNRALQPPQPIVNNIKPVPPEELTPSKQIQLPDPVPVITPIISNKNIIDFYGQKVELAPLPVVTLEGQSQKALQVFWKANSETNYQSTVKEFNRLKKELLLSDWAMFLLVQKYVEQNSNNNNQAIAASWFLLANLGYEVRVGRGDESLLLLITSEQKLFGMPYYPINGKKYYQLLGAASKNVRSYPGEFSGANKSFDMRFMKTLKTVADIHYRNIKTTVNGDELNIKLPYDLQRIKYLATYPQLDLRYYFEAPVDPITVKGLQQEIPALLTGSKDNKASQLLHLIHNSFPYAVDNQQFGHENYLTVEESLHYQASDCEDRSVLFAWLAKDLLAEPVVALAYKGHISTALTRKGRLVSADPTYIGASLGDIMPNFEGVQPEVIRF